MATVGQLVVRVGTDLSGLESGMRTAQTSLQNFGTSLRGLGTRMSAGITAPLAGIATMAFKSAADFEQSMNLIQAMSGGTADEMAALQQQALDLGASTVFSAGEAAAAMLELSKAGMSLDEVGASIEGVMALASAGGIELADAATITANAINTFGLEASDATEVANIFAAAANASSADVADLAQGFRMAGAVFAANNQSVADLAASLAILANNGIAGSDAGTSLKTMMMRLAAPTAEAQSVIDKLGIAVYDATGAMLPWGEIIGQLETATEGMSDAQRNSALQTIFGADAIRAANILIDEGTVGYTEMTEAVNQQGAAQGLAEARMRGLSGAIEYLKGSIDSLLIGQALPFTDTLGDIIRKGADLISRIGELSPEMQRWGAIIAVVAAAAGPLLIALGTLASVVGALISPIGLVVAAVAALGVAWAFNWGGIRDKTMAAWQAIQPALATAGAWFRATLPAALETLQSAFSTAWETIQSVWQTLSTFFGPAIQRLRTAFSGLGGQFSALGPTASTLVQTIVSAFARLWENVEPILRVLGAILGAVIDFGINLFAAAVTNLGAIVGPIFNQIGAIITFVSNTISSVLGVIVNLVRGDFTGAWQEAQNLLTGFSTFVLSTFDNLWQVLRSVFIAVKDAVVNTLTDMGVNVQAILDGIKSWWETTWTEIKEFVQPAIDIVNEVKAALEALWDWLQKHVFNNPFAGWGAPAVPAPGGAEAGGWSDANGPGLGNPNTYPDGTGSGGIPGLDKIYGQGVTLPSSRRLGGLDLAPAMAGVTVGPVYVNSEIDLEQLRLKLADLTRRRA